MTVSDKTNVFGSFSLKSIHRRAAAIVFCLTMIFGAQVANAATFMVSNNNDSGAGSLREAIDSANVNADLDAIIFSSGVTTIEPLTPLPVIRYPVIIDGGAVNGQPGTSARVELSGASTASSINATTNDQFGLQIAATAPGSTIRGLIINRFGNAGIRTAANNTLILQNVIGTNLNNVTGIGNVNQGILIVGSTGNVIGGANAADRNVISGNQGSGIAVTRGGAATIINNYIGVGGNGTTDVGNTFDGIIIAESSNSIIGGRDAASRNVISGNNGNGVYIAQNRAGFPATGNVVQGNYIGVNSLGAGADVTLGNVSVGNDGSGVVLEAGGNIIGGNVAGARNIVSDNRSNGISIGTNFATGNTVAANFIGVAADKTPLRNRSNGVQISNLAFGNTIGGANVSIGACDNACNLIANNGDTAANSARAGVYLDSSAGNGNTIRRNSIFSNTELGIDLAVPSQSTDTSFVPGTGTTPNDAGDPDTGPNTLQNYPVLTAADTNGSISGTLNSTPNTTFVIDFYRNTTSGNQAETYIGSQFVNTDGSGNAVIGYATPATLAAAQLVTATATSVSGASIGDTSEISQSQAVAAATAQSGAGFEADVFNRPNGDGNIDGNDVAQIRNFALGLETPATNPNEFQRADCFPFDTRGNGIIDGNDVAQARNYSLGVESRQAAGGPTQPNPSPSPLNFASPMMSNGKTFRRSADFNSPTASRDVRVVSTNGSVGNQVTVMINATAVGDESVYNFSINYDTTKLTFVSFTRTGGAGGAVFANTQTPGQFGFNVDFSNQPNGHIAPGNNQNLLSITFTVANNQALANTSTDITFGDTPARRSVSDNGPPVRDLTSGTTFTSGTVTINGPTAAGVSVEGRVTAQGRGVSGARVSITGADGSARFALTSAFGYYRFTDVEAGATYTLGVKARGYAFPSRVLVVNEDVTRLNFEAESKRRRL